ncbi:MAG: glucoamylase family protein [Candidatus Omnitrophota bacterium]
MKTIVALVLVLSVVSYPAACLYAGNGGTAQDEFVDKIEKDTFRYFWENADPDTGLIADNASAGAPCSIAATGFGLAVICIGHSRGWITYDEAYNRVFRTLKTFRNTLKNEHGFYYHFVDMKTGRRVWKSELSSIDSAIFFAGALFAAQYFKGTELERLANSLYLRADWKWMTNGTSLLCMGWTPENGFLGSYWDWYNEGLIAYILAIGSPTYPIPAECWKAWRKPVGEYGGYKVVYSFFGSLFTYQFAHAWVDFRNIEDNGINYWQNSINAVHANRKFCIDNARSHKGYGEDGWGLTAGDGPGGYKGYGAMPAEKLIQDGTINPYGMAASMPFVPELSLKSLKKIYDRHGSSVYGEYGFKAGYNIDKNWFSSNYIGIDQGVTVLMIENYRTGMVWENFMRNQCVKSWMELCGFTVKAP